MKVRATEMSSRLNVRIKELHRIAAPGEEFDVSPSRVEVLGGNNRFKAVFAIPCEDDTKQVSKKKKNTKKTRVEE